MSAGALCTAPASPLPACVGRSSGARIGGGVDMECVDEWARDGGWDVGAECSECETRGSLAQNESPALRHAIQL